MEKEKGLVLLMARTKNYPKEITYICINCEHKDLYIKDDTNACPVRCKKCKSINMMKEL